uniref:Uncharacterized protein n=1 Tax=Bracon brevicornis TaxID=1563983 RepID=A0A6V7JA93_9HYME
MVPEDIVTPWEGFYVCYAVLKIRKTYIGLSHVELNIGSNLAYYIAMENIPFHHLRLRTTALGVELLNPSFEAIVIHEEGMEKKSLRCNQWIYLKRSAKIVLANGEELEVICKDGMHEVVKTNEEILWAGALDFSRTIPRCDATKLSLNHPFMREAFAYYKDFAEECLCNQKMPPIELSFKGPRFPNIIIYHCSIVLGSEISAVYY